MGPLGLLDDLGGAVHPDDATIGNVPRQVDRDGAWAAADVEAGRGDERRAHKADAAHGKAEGHALAG